MHEDIDDFDPDMDAYYRMHPDERSLRNQKYYLYKKYADNKISYDRFISDLETKFQEVLEIDEWEEIKKYNEIRSTKIREEENRKAVEKYEKQKGKEEFNEQFGCFFMIIALISIIAGAISGMISK